jgi:hypothetical protein
VRGMCARAHFDMLLESLGNFDRVNQVETSARLAPRDRRCGRIVRAVRILFLSGPRAFACARLLSRLASLYDRQGSFA